ncbi:MAG: PC4/YdbC family ssDNA-binding protein [Methylobacterium sp.]|uniref:PC4/YdbC family ssDNA-binding protein n=1 Tax=Methylobacterium sp. TaxID=409 RepID=UPI002726C38B|nr:PC4/YdbC family ssDNA-binding protein [Methylobacterium sp.]MDO9426024.1 PC4/YdbC family ssDNA-binding protein [Methylobacterium sp.]
MSNLRTVATVRKNNSEEIRISVVTGDGFTLVDLRVFAAPKTSRGEPYPTTNGIRLAKSTLPALIQALQAAEREVSP